MKIRGSILGLIAIAAVLVVMVIWFGKKKSVETASVDSVETKTTPLATPEARVPITSTSSPKANTLPASAVSATTIPTMGSKEQQMADILSAGNDVPIVFYGKLEDQFGSPVIGAEITGTTTIISGGAVGANRVSVISDDNGFFQLNAGNGQSLGLMPRKAGYALATTSTEFSYSHLNEGYYVPNERNPTVIKMWKLQGIESLVSIDQHYEIPYTNAPMNFDLLTGKIVPAGGDIKLTVNRSPGVISGRNRLDWSVQIEAIDGGVIDSGGQDRVTYAAPETGYEPSAIFLFSTNSPNKWAGGFDQGFFVKSRNGLVYSKLGFSFSINLDPNDLMSLTFGGVANPNSSRNWEGDPNTMKVVGQ